MLPLNRFTIVLDTCTVPYLRDSLQIEVIHPDQPSHT
jgi:hypothetical protein